MPSVHADIVHTSFREIWSLPAPSLFLQSQSHAVMTAPVQSGDILAGKYRVDKLLGEGGMGLVIAATDEQLHRSVAIKFLLPEFANHPEASPRFMREARAAVRIKSEHIARVIDVNTLPNGSPYMVMEYLQGSDLSQVIGERGPVAVSEAVYWVLQACDAIAEAHSYGIVHRDLKPANLFLATQPGGGEKIKVLDFGISKNDTCEDISLTRTASMMGSPLYMSPEQMRSTKDVDARTDIWALGVILHELLTGRLPFQAGSVPELSAKILLEAPETIDRDDVPDAIRAAIRMALAKQVNDRYSNIADFAAAISQSAPRQARPNLERISRVMTAVGIDHVNTSMPTSVPPAGAGASRLQPVDVRHRGSGGGALREPRSHAGTVGQWGNTHGPGAAARRSPKLIGVAAAVFLLGAGGLYLFGPDLGQGTTSEELTTSATDPPNAVAAVSRRDRQVPAVIDVAEGKSETGENEPEQAPASSAVEAQEPVVAVEAQEEPVVAVEGDAPRNPGIGITPTPLRGAASKSSAVGKKALEADSAQQEGVEGSATTAKPAASSILDDVVPGQASAAPAEKPPAKAPKARVVKRVPSSPKVVAPAKVSLPPAESPTEKAPSLRDKFGGRK